MAESGLQGVRQQIHDLLHDITRQRSSQSSDRTCSIPLLSCRSDQLCIQLNRLVGLEGNGDLVDALGLVLEAADILSEAAVNLSVQPSVSDQAPLNESEGGRGRPKYHVTTEQIRF